MTPEAANEKDAPIRAVITVERGSFGRWYTEVTYPGDDFGGFDMTLTSDIGTPFLSSWSRRRALRLGVRAALRHGGVDRVVIEVAA